MSVDAIKKELAELPLRDRRHVQAFLIALENSGNAAYRRKLAMKIDKPASEFATLEEMDARLKTAPRGKK